MSSIEKALYGPMNCISEVCEWQFRIFLPIYTGKNSDQVYGLDWQEPGKSAQKLKLFSWQSCALLGLETDN